ncbi:ricin-type beta-trefoil lectin domain protein [Streptomyces sp. NPDC127084]|uniref:ricin-type beta-trefoil lectin domain protein n=1 Tax=Streptomyces sp. NPDC127084 TaxID=3347133 RepID=UPI00364F5872
MSTAVLTSAVLVFGDEEQRPIGALPSDALRPPAGLPLAGVAGGLGAGTATASPRTTTDPSPSASASASKPSKATVRPSAEPEVSSSPAGVAYVGAASALCIDASNTRLQLAACDGGAAQLFTHGSAQELRIATGLCAGVPGGGTRGSVVVAEECNGDRHQRWAILDDGSVRQGSLCLDAFNAGTDPGTPIQLWDCGGGGNQVWRASTEGR